MRICVADTETTGLRGPSILPLDKQPSCISFYANVIDENGVSLETLDLHFNPGFPVEPIITKITGLTNEFLADKPAFSVHEEQIRNLIMSCDEVIFHNASFDCGILNDEFKRCGMFEKMVWPKVICSVESTMFMKGHRLNLTKLHTELFGSPFSDAHSASGDVAALTKCVIKLREMGAI